MELLVLIISYTALVVSILGLFLSIFFLVQTLRALKARDRAVQSSKRLNTDVEQIVAGEKSRSETN